MISWDKSQSLPTYMIEPFLSRGWNMGVELCDQVWPPHNYTWIHSEKGKLWNEIEKCRRYRTSAQNMLSNNWERKLENFHQNHAQGKFLLLWVASDVWLYSTFFWGITDALSFYSKSFSFIKSLQKLYWPIIYWNRPILPVKKLFPKKALHHGLGNNYTIRMVKVS